MGKWSQKQLRGGAGQGSYSLAPPADSDWDFVQNSPGDPEGDATIIGPVPPTADQFQMRYGVNVPPNTDADPRDVGDISETSGSVFLVPLTAVIRWYSTDGGALSPFSEPKQFTPTP